MKKLISLLLAVAMVMSFAGCIATSNDNTTAVATEEDTEAPTVTTATDSDEPIVVTFWSWLPTTDQQDAIISAFEAENPDIKIDYIRTEQEDFFEKLQVAMASGTGPDLYGMTTGAKMEQYAKFSADMGAAADQYWPGWDGIISEAAVEQCTTEDGTVAGMPLLIAGMTTLLYNKTLMDECGVDKVPTTYAELQDAAAKAAEHGYVCVAAGAADDWINSDWFVQASNSFEPGAVYEAEQGLRSWTDPCFVDTMQAWQDHFNNGIFEEGALGVATYPDARDQYFFARESLFFLTGSWHIGPTSTSNTEIIGTAIGDAGDVLGMEPYPAVAEGGAIVGTAGVDVLVCMNKDCQVQEAAMKFVQFLADGGGQQYWVNYLQGAPVSSNITYTGEIDGELQQQSIDNVNAYIQNAAGNRKLSNSELEKAIQVAMQNVAAGADPLTELEAVQAVQDSL